MKQYTEKIVILVVYLVIITIFLGILVIRAIDLYNLYLFKQNSININAKVIEIVDEKKILIRYIIEGKVYKKQLVVGEKWVQNYSNKNNIYIQIKETNYKHVIYNTKKKIYRETFYIFIGIFLIIWLLHYVIEIIMELRSDGQKSF